MYISDSVFVQDLLNLAIDIYKQKKSGKTPKYKNVIFENATKLGRCQQNIRELVEALVWGNERRWDDAACCAYSTHLNLAKKYQNISYSQTKPGDLIYTNNGGGICSTCGKQSGHVMLYLKNENHRKMMWQNTSYNSLGLTIIPMRDSQKTNICGIYRLFNDCETTKIIDIATNKILSEIDGDWDFVADHTKDQNKIYVKNS